MKRDIRMEITLQAKVRSEHFLKNEKQFHLGMLPTEQANPKTRDLDKTFSQSVEAGLERLFAVDEDIIPMVEKIFAGKVFCHDAGSVLQGRCQWR